jgi:hypothetical protein
MNINVPAEITTVPFEPSMLEQPFLGLVQLGPDGARTLLGYNAKNRKVRNGRVEQYADAIIDGRWQLSPDAIAYEDGQLINGQHRCRAVVAAGQTVPVILMSNMGSAFDVTDNGASRTAADILFLAGLTEWPGALAAAAKLYLRQCGHSVHVLSDNRYVERWVIDHAELETWIAHYEPVTRNTGNPANRLFSVPVAVLSYALEAGGYRTISPSPKGKLTHGEVDRDTVMALGYETTTGLGLNSETDPIYVVRSQVARLLDNRNTATAVSSAMILDIVTKAWHARIDGRTPTRYKFGSVGEWPYGQTNSG